MKVNCYWTRAAREYLEEEVTNWSIFRRLLCELDKLVLLCKIAKADEVQRWRPTVYGFVRIPSEIVVGNVWVVKRVLKSYEAYR